MDNTDYLKHISDKINTGIIVLNLDFQIVVWNNFLRMHTNKQAEDVLGLSIFSVFPEISQKWFIRKLSSVLQLGTQSFCSWEQRHHLFELPHTQQMTTFSDVMAQNCTFLPIDNHRGYVTHVCILIEDATEICHYHYVHVQAFEKLKIANRIDGLTQIFNRTHWNICLEKEFCRAQRYKKNLAVIMFDLDHFKILNDTYGHQCGDKVLVEVAARIKALLRGCDLFGRYGGEEFAVILPETSLKGAQEAAERIRGALYDEHINFKNQSIEISASVGVATMNADYKNCEEIVNDADMAMYRAKKNGRNNVCIANH